MTSQRLDYPPVSNCNDWVEDENLLGAEAVLIYWSVGTERCHKRGDATADRKSSGDP
jgi:hypothetical protein